ncbi:hypothetical protein Glove_726g5 [Diversispora epigaea]|uniref:Uncharacterized protein n=1 Tax=Diversispora epigaea TaxID=1348612 RepID=A0A397G510_9GLOM|nr:hypothetical protein Glove_726g5 [Diversispora epigaea]
MDIMFNIMKWVILNMTLMAFPSDQNFNLEKIITLEPAEASKFSYIIGWLIYKLIKNEYTTRGHLKFEIICAHLKVLSSEQVIYDLLCNVPMLESFNNLLNISSHILISGSDEKQELNDDKGTASLRENLKSIIEKIENKSIMKKSNLPKDPTLALEQLQIWTKSKGVKEEFSKIFLVTELQWLMWAFGDNVKNKEKRI